MASSKRSPSVLVTDSRDRPSTRISAAGNAPPHRAGLPARFSNMRFMTVENVLRHSCDIPSMQPRVPPGLRPTSAAVRRGSPGAGDGGGGSGLPTLVSTRTGQQNVPTRTTKVSEKLVLLPEMGSMDEKDDEEEDDEVSGAEEDRLLRDYEDEDESAPLRDEELIALRKRGGLRGRTNAERMSKVARRGKLARVTAYCTAQAYKMKATAEFLRETHKAKAKLYDDCLYAAYALPLLGGKYGYHVQSRPILKTPGTGKTVLDLEIERNERRDDREGYFDIGKYGVRGHDAYEEGDRSRDSLYLDGSGACDSHHPPDTADRDDVEERDPHDHAEVLDRNDNEQSMGPVKPASDAISFAEMFVFFYGVVVFWNFTERQERDILADLTFAKNKIGESLMARQIDAGDFETEEFHFEYSPNVKKPRVFHDMITLLPRADHMVKLSISHAIAQSTKLCFFEGRMNETMLGAQHVPKRMALTGELNMTRTETVKILGRLFKSRVDINLSSNILDVPNFFWDSEPTLHPLYVAVREYLEIDLRTQVLNERCKVFLDLTEILTNSVARAKMSYITWIIIVLILISIAVTVTEVVLRSGILRENVTSGHGSDKALTRISLPLDLRRLPDLSTKAANILLEDLRAWGAGLEEEQRAAICGSEVFGTK